MGDPLAEVSPEEFRAAVSRFPSGIAFVTANGDDGPVALAVTGPLLASYDPPLVLVCIPRSAVGFATFQAAVSFGISFLSQSQVDMAGRFASGALPDMSANDWITGAAADVPLLHAATVRFECASYDRHAAGDHIIMVGEVLSAAIQDTPPLASNSRLS